MLCGQDPAYVLDILNMIDGYVPTERDRPSLSVTDLTAICHRQNYIKKNYDYWEKPSGLYFLWRGDLVHTLLQRVENPNWIKEKKFTIEWEVKLHGEIVEVYIVMKPDVIDTSTLEIRDYKTTGSVFRATKNHSISHKKQLGVYRWGVKKHYDILCKNYSDSYFDMKQPMLYQVPLMPFDEVEKFIQQQGEIILDFRLNDKIPNVLKQFPTYWMCRDYCVVNSICAKLHYKEGK